MYPMIQIENLSKTFVNGKHEPIRAVQNINLKVGNEICVLLGPSGCGKSTLLRQIAGLDPPTSGRVVVKGRIVQGPGPDRGMVFQKYTSFPWLTVANDVSYGLRLRGMSRKECEAQVRYWINEVGLSSFAHSYPETLSGGMQQRVAIARTLAVRPEVVLMDEPFGALDAQTRSEMQELLLSIRRQTDATIVFVTHDVEEALYLGDSLVMMRCGEIAPPKDLRSLFGQHREPSIKQMNSFIEAERAVLRMLRAEEAHDAQDKVQSDSASLSGND